MKITDADKRRAAVLQDWNFRVVCRADDLFLAPELLLKSVVGNVYGHPNPRHHDGKRVVIGTVRAVDGRFVKTRRTTYRLGRVSRRYRAWMSKTGIDYDAQNPIKLINSEAVT